MKSYTNIEQSKKLAEILPPESADMYYACGAIAPDIMIGNKQDYRCYTMCWSLSALFEALPKQINGNTKTLYWYNDDYYCSYDDGRSLVGEWVYSENPIDACYDMILKLKEKNLL